MIIKHIIQKFLVLSIMSISWLTTDAQNERNQFLDSAESGRTDFSIPIKAGEAETFLPVSVIKGIETGPVFTIIAGIHGYEYPPIIAVQEVLNQIDFTKLKGTIIIVPIANVASFYGRTPFISPIDGKNLNNVFPGQKDGSVTEQIAFTITEDIISQSDIFLDIHAGDASEDLLPFVCYYEKADSPDQTRLADELCRISGFQTIVSYPYTISQDQPALYAFKQAVQDGKTGLSIESGKLGNVQKEAVYQIKTAIYNMLEEMKMYSRNEPSVQQIPYRFYNKQSYIKSTVQGILYSDYLAGDSVVENSVIGYITDPFGNKLQDIKASATGTLLYKIATPPVNPDETLFCIGYKD